MLVVNGKVDNRHVVDVVGTVYMSAIVINNDGSYENVFYKDNDDMRTWGNDYVLDATDEEKEAYRKYRNDFKNGDQVKIVSGKKMKGEIKTIESKYTYNVGALYQHGNVEYLRFTDGTAVQAKHCEIL